MQNEWIAVIDNGGDAVPKREKWRTVTAPSAQEAAFEYVSQNVNIQGPGEQTVKILVIMLSQYNMAEGWSGCLVHSFNVTLRKEDPDQVARDLEAKRAERLALGNGSEWVRVWERTGNRAGNQAPGISRRR